MDFKEQIALLISNVTDLEKDEILSLIEIPNSDMGDFAFPCFKLAKTMKKAPNIIASELAEKIEKKEFISNIQVVNAYINFYVSKSIYVEKVLNNVLKEKDNFGNNDMGKDKTVVIDYSSPNIAKPFHIGHLRSTVIGNSLYKIYKKLGYNVVGINHLGDWGTQFGKLIVAYKKWGNKELVEKDDIKELSKIYVKFHEESEKNPALEDEARLWLVKMQEGDKEALELWKWFCDISMKEFERVYKMLNISFDSYAGESFYNDKMQAVVDELFEKNILVESEGAKIVDLEQYNMPPCLILRSDGGTLYPTRDIAAAFYRKKEYNFEKCLYITALDQNLHFAQWFKVIDIMGYDWAKDLVHIPFGLVSLNDGKLSTRKGHVVLMEDILNHAIEKTRGIIEEKNPNLENKEKIAKDVGIGAVIFNDLFNSRVKNVVFDLERMLNFQGETGPYVQYTHARACSILKKENFNEDLLKNIDYSLICDEFSFELVKLLSQYPDKIVDASNKYEPFIITRHLVNICQAFNKFYDENNIKNSETELKNSRLAIVYATKTVIANGLYLLGINAPEKM
ncbi:arginine--tRNA ligase [uncultured Tyzzerella sp.]|uniref:arginine--tRNA ligase n=1 Tax=uncultured Tyzzerella sp. TaxID=2321398 RepID=UPI002942A2FF|nr:arginine--tRNA ligase [uncultured Tyzzerella sp.]